MAEDFQPSNWWNNSRRSGFDGSQAINSPAAPSLACSTTISDSFTWSPANEISDSKPRLCDNQIDVDYLHISGLGYSTLSTDWNQTLVRSSGKAESSFQAMLQEDLSARPFCSRQELGESSTTIPFQDMIFSTSSASSSYINSSLMLQGLVEQDKRFHQPFFHNQQMAEQYRSQTMAYHGFSNEALEPSWNKLPQLFKDFPHKQQSDINHLQFTNNNPFWNASAGFYPFALPSPGVQLFESKPGGSMTAKSSEGVPEKKTSNESELKRPRIETLSPLPVTFKVRKEKLGDRITALQQLVSPFGKTATASVLHETIEYIKYLHDQVSVLSTPYLRNARPMQQEKKFDKSKDGEEPRQDLRSRGLCLVPIASTYTMAGDQTISDFWTPAPGRTSW